LKPTVDALIVSIQDQLPDRPLSSLPPERDSPESEPKGLVLKLKPIPAIDYPRRQDLFVAISSNESLWRAQHEDEFFYSVRYSRHGEVFCYLKIDGTEGLDEDQFPDRASIEDALNAILVPARAGCVIGGGTGLRYSYLDLALTDVNSAVPLITARLRAGKIPRHAWLLFFDAPLAHEWIGMYDHTPAPPEPADHPGDIGAPESLQ
jgi:hypothetical protein